MTRSRKPTLAVWKFASCDGCQLALLDCEDELLTIASIVQIANFAEASTAAVRGPYDVSLVEGSITTAHDAERIHAIRRASGTLVAIGACATAGGIQALRNFGDVRGMAAAVYPSPRYIDVLKTSTPIGDHVHVDFELRGCPIDKGQLLEALAALVAGRAPALPDYAVCMECKQRGIVCGLVRFGPPCLGPVTQAGCGALCPSFHRGCFGCFGPKENANPGALADRWIALGMPGADVVRALRGFTAWAEPFRKAGEAHDR